MKFKKLIAMALAFAMALTLAVPAMAAKPKKNNAPAVAPNYTVDKIEDSKDPVTGETIVNPDKTAVENGAQIDTAGWPEIYIKQANDVFIWVPATDTRNNTDIIAQARANDKSLNNEGKKDADTFVVRGNGNATLHGQTVVTVAGGILTVMGPISHATFTENPAPTFPDPDDGDGKVNATFTITKYLNEYGTPGVDFVFDIIPVVDGVEGASVGTITSNAEGIASGTFEVPAGQYIIREQVNADMYMPVDDVLVTVDENGLTSFDDSAFDGTITNVQWGKLEYTTPEVTEKYTEMWHTPIYEYSEEDTRVSRIESDLPGYITGEKIYNDNGKTNGFTYLIIEKAELEAAPATIRIAQSDPSNSFSPDIAPADPWENAIHAEYKLEIVEDKLVVTSNLPQFGFAVYGPNDKIEGNKDFGKYGPKDEANYDSTEGGYYVKSWPLPELGENGTTFRFYIHYKVGYTTATVTGCKSDPDSLITHECERVYTGNDVAVTVKDGDTVVTDLTKMAPGAYTVTVTANGETLNTQTVTVNPGKTTTVTFPSGLTVQGADEYWCADKNCKNYSKHDQNYYVAPEATVEG